MADSWGINLRGPVSDGSSKSKPCFDFRRRGSCRFGLRCKFSHDRVGQQRVPSTRHSNNGTATTCDGKLRQWKRLLEMGEMGAYAPELSSSVVGRFFQLGLELMDGDIGAAQEAIKRLATEPGLAFIKALADRHIPAADDKASKIALWEAEVKPLFALIVHPCVVDSAVLEQQVASVFNFILGVGGSRMTRVFTYIAQLSNFPSTSTTQSKSSRIAMVELSLAVLSKVFDCNTNNIVHPEFIKLVSYFSKVIERASNPEDEFSRLQASRYLDYMQQRLEVGEKIPDLQNRPRVPITRESFVLRRDLPGQLSADGPRHGNDHAKITKIKIMPTYDEIVSPRGEYLPTNNPSEWHTQGIRGRLDREFRLVREDTVGQLRDAVREILEFARNPGNNRSHGSNTLRTYTYERPTTIDVNLHRIGGLEMVVRCSQPPGVLKMSAKKRKDWWIQSKRLQAGALVCLFDITGSILFCVVSDTTMRCQGDKNARTINENEEPDSSKTKQPLTLSDDATHLFVNLQFVDAGKNEITQALRWYRNIGSSPHRYLVEFPGVLLDSFKHTLSALQQMHEKPGIPFKTLVAPSDSSSSEIEINPPQYARKAGFTFDLSCLTNDNIPFTVDPQRLPAPSVLASQSTLDPTQSAGLLSTLSREFSLIQGPPGTGKSYTGEKIIKVLLKSRKQAKLGPILCVCYTNHALDQLLEHLLDDGTKGIIRIGSRSKSERLQSLNLRTVAKEMLYTKSEKSGLWEAEQDVREHVREGNVLLKELSSCESWTSVKAFLALEHRRQHAELFGEDQDGWQTVIHQPEKVIDRWLTGGREIVRPTLPLENLKSTMLQIMSNDERRLLHRYWLKSIRDPIIARLSKVHENYNKAVKHRNTIRGDVDLRCLHMAEVVGVTTTGLARNLDLLRKLRCKVLLCEEAGEVMEAHVLTALLPSVEHAILIGDHLQLRPQIQNYDLQSTNPRGRQYSLDMSLFERLVKPPHETDPKLPYSVLETQRRMHPSIAELVRSTLYPSLKDAKTVKDYPEVVGMKRRLFWFHHNRLENASESNDSLSTSRSNSFEIEMTVALVSHLSQQGAYGPGDIAVITPYLGQLHLLRRRMESMFEICVNDRDLDELEALQADGSDTPPPVHLVSKTTLLKSVRVATVDNFQGEEAKVIVISLVRSNPQSNCGFLRTSNRINVLLSRAQHGMYIIGNAETCKEVPMWVDVINMLATKDNLGTELELQCPRHPDTPILVSEPDHFAQFSPESGCNLPCDKRLLCGHSCTGRCHSDNLHLAVKCLEDCPRLKKSCNHACPLRCGDRCHDKCQFVLKGANLLLPCGHHISSPRCWEAQDLASVRCTKEVIRNVPGCGHSVRVQCHTDVATANYRCTAICGSHRICGHTCNSVCFRCNTREEGEVTKQNHGTCQQRCGRNYSTCQHSCIQPCHGDAPCNPCRERCEVRCSHSRCSKYCNEPCVPCAQATCESSCAHSKCTAPCSAPCNWVPCSLRCEMMLECGHQCPSICGEICPASTYCQQCASDDIKSVCVDFLEMKEYHEVDLNQDPCIFPNCGHFLTVSSMDGQMEMGIYYELDEDGLPTGISGSNEPFSMDNKGIKVCATCRGPLRNISRYGRIVRRAMLDEATKKFISWSNAEYRSLAAGLIEEQKKLSSMDPTAIRARDAEATGNLTLSGSRQRQIEIVKTYVATGRYNAISKFRNRIYSYTKKVRKEEQPFQRVAELVRHVNLQQGTDTDFRYDQSVIQVKGSLLASTLLLKCDVLILSDFFGLLPHQASGIAKPDIKLNLSGLLVDCESLIQLARSTMYPREEAQGHIFFAHLYAFSLSMTGSKPQASVTQAPITPPPSTAEKKPESPDELREICLSHIKQARKLLDDNPSISALRNDIDAVEEIVNGGVYRPVTAEELREVYMASTGELSGTGHWYTCRNGHPFTINNCGMAMEEATCPECGAPIGGRNHVSVEGVRHAAEIEEIARGMDRVRL